MHLSWKMSGNAQRSLQHNTTSNVSVAVNPMYDSTRTEKGNEFIEFRRTDGYKLTDIVPNIIPALS